MSRNERHRDHRDGEHQQELVTRLIQVNTGMRISVMPGARMLRMVTMKLTPPTSEAMPVICRPRA